MTFPFGASSLDQSAPSKSRERGGATARMCFFFLRGSFVLKGSGGLTSNSHLLSFLWSPDQNATQHLLLLPHSILTTTDSATATLAAVLAAPPQAALPAPLAAPPVAAPPPPTSPGYTSSSSGCTFTSSGCTPNSSDCTSSPGCPGGAFSDLCWRDQTC